MALVLQSVNIKGNQYTFNYFPYYIGINIEILVMSQARIVSLVPFTST